MLTIFMGVSNKSLVFYFITWVGDEVRIVSPCVRQPILLEQSALLLSGPDKLGLVATTL